MPATGPPPRGRNAVLRDGSIAVALFGSGALRVASAGLQFVVALLLARFLTAHDYGRFVLVTAVAQLVLIAGASGVDRHLVVRHHGVPDGSGVGASQVLAATWITLVSTAAITLAGTWVLGLPSWWMWLAPVVLAAGALRIVRTSFVAEGRPVEGQVHELVTSQVVLIVVLVVVRLASGGSRLTDHTALALYVVACAVVLPWQLRLAGRKLTLRPGWRSVDLVSHLRSAAPFMATTALYVVYARVDLVMIGALRGERAAAEYAVAVRATDLVPLLLPAAAAVLNPVMAAAARAGDGARLGRAMVLASTYATAFAVLAAVALIAFRGPLLALFGTEYGAGATVLVVLAIAQVFSTAMGPNGMALQMAGHASQAAVAVGWSAATNVVLNLALIPYLGIDGAAVATAISLVIRNVLLAAQAARLLDVPPGLVGWARRRRSG